MAVYEEYPLPEQGFIRVATIHPGRFWDKIMISLAVVEFLEADPPVYEALSYVWGSEDDPEIIWILADAGKTFELPITQNLGVALRHLRRHSEPRVVWIDAVCINQSNNTEKGHQVMRMGEIFRTAKRVVGFLGQEDNDSAHAINIMSDIGSQVDVEWEPVNMWPAKHCTDPTICDKDCALRVTTRDMCAIYHILFRNWFDRLWIRQEILIANPHAVLQCGMLEINWLEFRRALLCLFIKPTISFQHSHQFRKRMNSISGLIFPRRSISLIQLRLHFDGAICRDPRDKIFAIRSLLAPEEKACCPVPDYNKPWIEVYKDVTLRWIRKFGLLALLRECHFEPGASHPSWIPNWSKAVSIRPLCQQPFLASSRLRTYIELPAEGVLRVSGVVATEIQEVQPIPELSNVTTKELFAIHHRVLFGEGVDHIDDNTLPDRQLDAYAKALVYGCVANDLTDIQFITLPGLREAKKVVAKLYSGTGYDPGLFEADSPEYDFLQRSRIIGGKKFARCSNGFFGIVPPDTQVGDQICVLIGCNGVMVLRPKANDQFLLLGEAYMDQLRIGEGLLGPLPENIRMYLTTHANRAVFGFLDTRSGQISFEDPRWKQLPVDLTGYREQVRKDGSALLFVHPEILRSIGLDVRYFDLV